MKNHINAFFAALSVFAFTACQHGDVQLHDHVKQDLNKMGLTAQNEGESAVQFHDYVKEDARSFKNTFNEYVHLHDYVRRDIEWLKANESKR